jgi:hypothetical protein
MIVKAKLGLVLRLKFSLAETDDKSDKTGSRYAGELVLSLLSLILGDQSRIARGRMRVWRRPQQAVFRC